MSSPDARIGIVTVTYNSAQVLGGFIDSLVRQDFTRFTVFVVDNASRDESAEILERAQQGGLHLKLVRNAENVGVAEGNNIGIRMAIQDGCTHVLLLNNDTEFPADLLRSLIACATQGHPVVVPKIYRGDSGRTLWYAGGKFARLRGYTGIHLGAETRDHGQFDVPRAVEYAPTCCMLVNVAVFESVGMMDARYFVYYDDTDFCLRMFRRNVQIWYHPAVALYHKVGSLTGGALSEFAIRMLMRNRIYYLKKNLPTALAFAASAGYRGYLLMRRCVGKDTREGHRAKMAAIAEGRKMALEYKRELRRPHGSGSQLGVNDLEGR